MPRLSTDGAETGARQRIEEALRNRPEKMPNHSVVWLQALWTTLREEEVISPIRLMKPEYQKQMRVLAHTGEPALLSFDIGSTCQVSPNKLSILQGDMSTSSKDPGVDRDLVRIDLYPGGTLSIALNVTRWRKVGGISSFNKVDPDWIQERLRQAWGFAYQWWEQIDPMARHSVLIYNAAILDANQYIMEKVVPSSMTSIPMVNRPDLILAYDSPRKVARSELQNPQGEISNTMDMLRLRFAQARTF